MTIALNFELVHSSANAFDGNTSPGLCVTSDGSIIAGLNQDDFPNHCQIWRSADNGASFQHITDLDGNTNYESHRLVNQPNGNIAWAAWDDSGNIVNVWHSGNNGLTWQNVAQFAGPQSGAKRGLVCNAAMGQRKASMIVGGRFQAAAQGGEIDFILSDDAGLTWDLAGAVNPGSHFPKPACMANGGAGKEITGMTNFTTFYSENEEDDWHASAALPTPANFLGGETHSLTWLDDAIVLLGAGGNSSTDKAWPYLYRSTDGGKTWSHIATADISNWPPTSGITKIFEVHRLTKDLSIFGWGPSNHDSKALTRLSIDKGLTWPIEPTGLSDGGTGRSNVNGAIVKTFDGHIIAMALHDVPGAANNEIWRGTLSC